MPKTLDCAIVDVFAERPFAGNQLAVVRGCGGLDAAAMQAIAREMNFSETAFVTAEGGGAARVRIFTPTVELPFAGHPVLGTAWVLAGGGVRRAQALDLAAGRVEARFDGDGLGWITPPPAELGAEVDSAAAAALLGLPERRLDRARPPRRAAVGPRFVLIGVDGLDSLRRARISPEAYAEVSGGDFMGVFAFAGEAYGPDADFAARMFFDAGGFREDPATGSANAAFARYLREFGVTGRVVVEQGFEIARPSRIYLDIGDPVRVGGRVQLVLTGALSVDGLAVDGLA